MSFDLTDILMPPLLALVFLAFAGMFGRVIRKTRPLTSFMRALTVYGALYTLGMGYIVLTVAKSHLPDWLYVALPVTWAAALGLIAWHLRRPSLRVGATKCD